MKRERKRKERKKEKQTDFIAKQRYCILGPYIDLFIESGKFQLVDFQEKLIHKACNKNSSA
jgi:hypothetical protein